MLRDMEQPECVVVCHTTRGTVVGGRVKLRTHTLGGIDSQTANQTKENVVGVKAQLATEYIL